MLRINWIIRQANMSGGTKSNRLIAEAMVRRGHDVRILHSTAGKPFPGWHHPRASWRWFQARMRDRRHPPRHHLEKSTAQLIPIDHAPILADDIPDADVTIGTWWETMEWVASYPPSKGLHAYFIRHYEIHGGDPERVRATYRLPALPLVIAGWLERLLEREFDRRDAVLVPNGVDRAQFQAPPREKSDPPTIGIVYSNQPWKGMDTAFEAIRIAQQELPELRVVAFASKPIEAGLTLPANFEFHLHPRQDELATLYAKADGWVVSSTSEGFGMPGIEAAACRCPVISTRCGGPEDYVEDGISGHLVEVGDAKGMARAILSIARLDPVGWKTMSDASFELSRRFDWDRSAETLEQALLSAMSRSTDGRYTIPSGGTPGAHESPASYMSSTC